MNHKRRLTGMLLIAILLVSFNIFHNIPHNAYSFGFHIISVIICFIIFLYTFRQYDIIKFYINKLNSKDEELNSVCNSLDAIILSVDLIKNSVQASAGAEKICGLKPEEFLKNPSIWRELVLSEDHHLLTSTHEELALGKHIKKQFRIIRKDGELRWLQLYLTPVLNKDNKLTKINGIATDITEQKLLQQMALENEECYKSLLELSPEAVAVHCNNKYIYANPAAVKILEVHSPEDLIDKSIFTYCHPNFYDIVHFRIENALKGTPAKSIEQDMLLSNGKIVKIESSSVAITYKGNKAIMTIFRDITERKATENALIEAESKYRSLVEKALVGVYIYQNGKLTYVNSFLEKISGYSKNELYNIDIKELIIPEYRETVLSDIANLQQNPVNLDEYIKAITKHGKVIDIRINATSTTYNGSSALIGTIVDVTESIQTTREMENNRRFLLDIFDAIQDGIFVLDKNKTIVSTNKTMEQWNLQSYPLIGKKCSEVYECTTDFCDNCPCSKAMKSKIPHKDTQPLLDSNNNTIRWLEKYAFPLLDESGDIAGVIMHLRDITDRKEKEEQIKRMAYYDALTGLPNRHMINSYIKKYSSDASFEPLKTTVMFIDLDRFKMINDTLGHDFGDIVLKYAAKRLKNCVRNNDLVCRQGGDEFVILMRNSDRDKAEKVAQRIINEFSFPFAFKGKEAYTTPSIGISCCTENCDNIEELIKYADVAMYFAKENGRNNYYFYNSNLSKILYNRMEMENGLRKALEHDEFILNYQPQVDFHTGDIIGLEALIRWQHPKLGLIPPSEFIPIAEETRAIIPIGIWVLRTACIQNKTWQKKGFSPIPVVVNVSLYQFYDKNFVKIVKDILQETALDPKYLELEITETIIQNVKELPSILQELKSIGIKISIDDFGTGYSTLNALKYLPVDILKIDKSFMDDVLSNPNASALVKTIIDMSYNLNLNVIAEGVEEENQISFLKQNRCNLGQGFFFSRPISAENITKLFYSSGFTSFKHN